MLEITIDNCYKCDLETINDPNNSQYISINRIDLEIETKCNWQVMSNQVYVFMKTCLYEDICDEKEFTVMSEESFIQHDVKNEQLKEENEKLRKETRNQK